MMLPTLEAQAFTVVIDPGHGGKDIGATGLKAKEKDINLAVAKLLGEMIKKNCDDTKIIYTRNNDRFLSLKQRAAIANEAAGDLFISIHTNSLAKKSKKRKTIAGASVYTLGLHRTAENLEVAKRENAVIELEEDYSTSYSGFDPNSSESYIIFELNQNKHMEQSIEFASYVQNEFITTAYRKDRGVRQAGFLVLAETSMPGVLVELDFICNPTQEKFLSSKKGQKKLATAIYNAFCKYRDKYVKREEIKAITIDEGTRQINKKEAPNNEIEYRIQFLTSSKKLNKTDKRLKGLSDIDFYIDNDIYKYTYGNTQSWDEAITILKKVKKQFPEAFIIKMKGGKRIK